MALGPYRTTPALVMGIIDTQKGVDLTPFIVLANQMTTDLCTYAPPSLVTPYTDGFVDSKMELIERWLSAHNYCIFDNQLAAAKAGTVAVSYQYKIDFGLKNTMYGQQAIMLDSLGGNLAAYDNTAQTKRKIVIKMGWLGTRRIRDSGWVDLTIVN